jgi:hypothetical protein
VSPILALIGGACIETGGFGSGHSLWLRRSPFTFSAEIWRGFHGAGRDNRDQLPQDHGCRSASCLALAGDEHNNCKLDNLETTLRQFDCPQDAPKHSLSPLHVIYKNGLG